MKKTIVALMALSGVAVADVTWYEVYSTENLTLNRGGASEIDSYQMPFADYFIAKPNGKDTSPYYGKVELSFTLTNVTDATSIIAFDSDSGSQAAWGVTVKEGSLYLGQMTQGTNNSIIMHSYTANCGNIGAVTTDTSYTLTILSLATGSPAGRGKDNFSVTLTNNVSGDVINTTVAGFGLNGGYLDRILIGGSNSPSNDSGSIGTITSMTVSIPEPATATLSLLALAGLAARRRRK